MKFKVITGMGLIGLAMTVAGLKIESLSSTAELCLVVFGLILASSAAYGAAMNR